MVYDYMNIHPHTFRTLAKICDTPSGKWLLDRVESAEKNTDPDMKKMSDMRLIAGCIMSELGVENHYNKINDIAHILWLVSYPDKAK